MTPAQKNLVRGYICLQGLSAALVTGAFPVTQLITISLLTAALAFFVLGSFASRVIFVSAFGLAWTASALVRMKFFEGETFQSGATPWFFANLAFVLVSAITVFCIEVANTKRDESGK